MTSNSEHLITPAEDDSPVISTRAACLLAEIVARFGINSPETAPQARIQEHLPLVPSTNTLNTLECFQCSARCVVGASVDWEITFLDSDRIRGLSLSVCAEPLAGNSIIYSAEHVL
jgi:hypothetical protein